MSSQPTQKSKDLKISSKQVINPTIVNEDKRKLNLLYIINRMERVSEKALTTLIAEMKEKGLDLGYEFNNIGNNTFSHSLKEDITSLLYLGFVENDLKTKKLSLSNDGKEFLEKSQIDEELKSKLDSMINDLKVKVNAIDEEYNLKMRNERRLRNGRR
ncbi:hypothetical protein [Sulfuracidifex tepidarius]|uniref:Uncharacterized protein n=1 Tax=Sulfuracidifex tepidarius TaxID=1294262 RepID=A0A510E485_9CREN|nr:hypothetical protein [Sulfuracidifex tepidarius]BBG24526.1 hypothetical protein IC006_1851 [Sulfuracidifex tepidarius]BBG27314.1 hypothetical protein IC007_1859 [Sulfuracidifex tepidarius]